MHITLSFYTKYGQMSAESYVSLKDNDKAISILQNVIKVIVITPTQTPILRTTDCTCIIYIFFYSV